MKIDVLTIFPGMFSPILDESIIERAQEKGIVEIKIHNLRNYTSDKHKKVDDRPFGGGPGMVFKPEPIIKAVETIRNKTNKAKVVLLSPQGRKLDQNLANKISKIEHLVLICGRYEGVDERIRKSVVDLEISIGDYVLTGGELPAMVLIDSVVRLIPGVLGNKDSVVGESFSDNLLEYPQYTRPASYRRMRVPQILLSGKHEEIKQWRRKQSLRKTIKERPDLQKTKITNKGVKNE